jgi:hypothetical protein
VETVDCKEQEVAPDTRYWKWLKTVLEKLGEEGMSSEDSENGDGFETTYHPRILPWRRSMDYELQLVDYEHRRVMKTVARRGAKPAPRKRRAESRVSTRDPVCGLPVALYNEEWLAKQTDLYIERTLQLSEENFKWKDWRVV